MARRSHFGRSFSSRNKPIENLDGADDPLVLLCRVIPWQKREIVSAEKNHVHGVPPFIIPVLSVIHIISTISSKLCFMHLIIRNFIIFNFIVVILLFILPNFGI